MSNAEHSSLRYYSDRAPEYEEIYERPERQTDLLALKELEPSALVCFIDNEYVEGSSTPISCTDDRGNTYQQRFLKDGKEFKVLKNFPTNEELKSAVAKWSKTAELRKFNYYWCLSYRLDPSGGGECGC